MADKNALVRELPGLCQANRQLFYEATPIFLARNITSWNTPTSKQFLNLFAYFPGDAATKGVGQFSMNNWTEEGTAVQTELISKFTNLKFLNVIFSFPSIVDGVPMEKFDYSNEQALWWNTGLHYDPEQDRSVEEEKAFLAKDLETFVAKFGLDRIIEMPKLNGLQFRFYVRSGGENVIGGGEPYRHRLCNPLWRWATQKLAEKWGVDVDNEEFHVTTTMPEDYDHVNMD
ncbi:hypothetical protein CC86DRAFT_370350 [Ophiobolus disseminans]|uniref:Uncharacterized protein n=1 Tax=Ophiobolus disseminans TaxID=1469910 RepID=A0A6A6ZZ23_9PLEO|nr:hypothetical protein CC86DRAFT_370350 [Ophiobolus disseminans]